MDYFYALLNTGIILILFWSLWDIESRITNYLDDSNYNYQLLAAQQIIMYHLLGYSSIKECISIIHTFELLSEDERKDLISILESNERIKNEQM